MTTSFERPWSQLSADEKAALAADPRAAVPVHLVPRLMSLGLIGRYGMYILGSRSRQTANGDEHFVSAQFAKFIDEQAR